MKFIGSALGDSVNHAARGASVFSRVVGSVDLVLADRCLANHIANARAASLFREERLIVVSAINRAVVQQTRDAAKTYQAKCAVGGRAGSENSKVGPTATVGRKIVQRDLINVG